MIKKILVPTDGSVHARKAIGYACDLALKYDAMVFLLHVVHPSGVSEDVLRFIKAQRVQNIPDRVLLQRLADRIIEQAME